MSCPLVGEAESRDRKMFRFPLFSGIPVDVELRQYSVQCWAANEPKRSLKEFQVCAAVSAHLREWSADAPQRSERKSTNSKTSACLSRGSDSGLLISLAYPSMSGRIAALDR